MEPISTLIVTALAAGAAAGLEGTVSQVVRDAYDGLKGLIKSKYGKAADSLDILEKSPSSEHLRSFADEQLAARAALDLLDRALGLAEPGRAADRVDRRVRALRGGRAGDAQGAEDRDVELHLV